MMKLIHVKGNTYAVEGRTLTGLYISGGNRCVLLDNGFSSEWESWKEFLASEDLRPEALLCTHMHIDHHGNSRRLKELFGARVVMPEAEAAICRNPILLYRYLNGYSRTEEFRRMLDSEITPCAIDETISAGQETLSASGSVFRVIHTPGHSADHVCYVTPDGVCFAGDALMSEDFLKSARIPFCIDWKEDRKSRLLLAGLPYRDWIFSHKGIFHGDVGGLVRRHVEVMDRQMEMMYRMLSERPLTRSGWEKKARAVFVMNTLSVEHMVRQKRNFRPYIEELIQSGRVEAVAMEGNLYYRQNSFWTPR